MYSSEGNSGNDSSLPAFDSLFLASSLLLNMAASTLLLTQAQPYPFSFNPQLTALIVIDMQRDFLEANGFGASLGNNVSLLMSAVAPISDVMSIARSHHLTVIHTREGHLPDLSDLTAAKRNRSRHSHSIGNNRTEKYFYLIAIESILNQGIGDLGPMGRILVRGEPGHEIVPTLKPLPDEPVVDKSGKGAFYGTELESLLRRRNIRSLVICGVTTEVCVLSTVIEANDRGFDCVVLNDCVASYHPNLHTAALEIIKNQSGIFGWVTSSDDFINSFNSQHN